MAVMDIRIPMAAAGASLLVLCVLWMSTRQPLAVRPAQGPVPEYTHADGHAHDLIQLTQKGEYLFDDRLTGMAAAVAMLRPKVEQPLPKATQWAANTGEGNPIRPNLPTPWSDQMDPLNPLPEYPRPQMVREQWMNLNGVWDFDALSSTNYAENGFVNSTALPRKIVVPFPVEAPLSGIMEHNSGFAYLLYKRTFKVPAAWRENGQRVMLRFGAVDWQTKVYVNKQFLGMHTGGYDKFAYDITDVLTGADEDQEVLVSVFDPTEFGHIALGKQRLHPPRHPSSIWYTSCTGIWQTVWLEPVPAAHLTRLDLIPDIDSNRLHVTAHASEAAGQDAPVVATASFNGSIVARVTGMAGRPFDLVIQQPLLWSPDKPWLYDLKVQLLQQSITLQKAADTDVQQNNTVDSVASYFGMRKVALGTLPGENVPRILLNNKFVFQLGLLDQGYWPDGIYTAPTDEALKYDIQAAKAMGYNLLRKHIKVEPDRWYYWADRLGMLVWQDMPSMFWEQDAFHPERSLPVMPSASEMQQWEAEYVRLIEEHYSFPCIVLYVVFNEAWGQFDTVRVTNEMRSRDRSRLFDPASGWNDADAGDVIDMHKYVGPDALAPTPTRASVLGEFGGLGLLVDQHQWIPGDSFNYEMQPDAAALEVRYLGLIRELQRLMEDPGRALCAAVYTELTDVEAEVNGWLTYDRWISKLPDMYAIPGAHKALLHAAAMLNHRE